MIKKTLSLLCIVLLLVTLFTACSPAPASSGEGTTLPPQSTEVPSATERTTPEATTEATTAATIETTTEATTESLTEEVITPAATEEATSTSAPSTFSIHFIDVGQADAALIECDGHFMLIDGGNRGDSSRLYTVLKNAGAETLDLVVATHPHEDHIGGLSGALNYATAQTILSPVLEYDSEIFETLKEYAHKKSTGLTVPESGDTYPLGSATVTILGLNLGEDTNDTSIVLRIDYGETSFLFTGDAELPAEKALVDGGANLRCTLLKVGHHGSETSTGYVFLRSVLPEVAVISVGEGNSYAHPEEAVLSRLRDAEVDLYRTDLMGDIFVTSDGKSLTVTPTRPAKEEALFTPAQTAPAEEKTEEATTGDHPSPTYVLNTSSHKFHLPDCKSVPTIKAENRSDTQETRDELMARGYSPCGSCNP